MLVSLIWLFVGVLVGLLLSAVFVPPPRKDAQLPTPFSNSVYHTPMGCVKFRTRRVPCSDSAGSLMSSEHK